MSSNLNFFIDLYINEAHITLSKVSDSNIDNIIFSGEGDINDWILKNNLYSKSFNIYENPFNCKENEVYELILKDSSGDGWTSHGTIGYIEYNEQKIYFENGYELKVYLTAGKGISLTNPNNNLLLKRTELEQSSIDIDFSSYTLVDSSDITWDYPTIYVKQEIKSLTFNSDWTLEYTGSYGNMDIWSTQIEIHSTDTENYTIIKLSRVDSSSFSLNSITYEPEGAHTYILENNNGYTIEVSDDNTGNDTQQTTLNINDSNFNDVEYVYFKCTAYEVCDDMCESNKMMAEEMGELYDEDDYLTKETKWKITNINLSYTGSAPEEGTVTTSELTDGSSLIDSTGYAYIPDTYDKIGDNAFYYESSLTSVDIPDSVKIIGSQAFRGTSITSVTIPNKVESIGSNAFSYSSLTEIIFDDESSLTFIDNDAFRGTRIATVTIPDSVEFIGNAAFAYTGNTLASVTFGNSLIYIGSEAFRGSIIEEVALPDSVRYINSAAFGYMSNIDTLTLGSSLYYVGSSAFRSFIANELVIPSSTRHIETEAFWSSTLSSVEMYEGIINLSPTTFNSSPNIRVNYSGSTVPNYSLNNGTITYIPTPEPEPEPEPEPVFVPEDGILTTALATDLIDDGEADIPYGYTTIADNAYYSSFYENTNLTSVNIPNSVTTIGSSAFRNTNLTSVNIPNSVTTIGSVAFFNCTSLTSVTIGNSVETIGVQAFSYCTSLTSVTIGNSVETIGNNAFRNCISLEEVTIPDSVINIGTQAFNDCTNLTSVTMYEGITTWGNNVFLNTSLDEVTVYYTDNQPDYDLYIPVTINYERIVIGDENGDGVVNVLDIVAAFNNGNKHLIQLIVDQILGR